MGRAQSHADCPKRLITSGVNPKQFQSVRVDASDYHLFDSPIFQDSLKVCSTRKARIPWAMFFLSGELLNTSYVIAAKTVVKTCLMISYFRAEVVAGTSSRTPQYQGIWSKSLANKNANNTVAVNGV